MIALMMMLTLIMMIMMNFIKPARQACEGKRKGRDERVTRGRIAVGDACKDAIVFFILPSN